MKILKLTASNIKRLVAVEIVPDGDVVTIAGRNGQGKSSLLDSIWWALAGAGVIQDEPIRKGQDKARVRLELGEGRTVELIAERKFRKGGKSELTFTNADGSPTKLPPQAMADSLIGALSFDPLAFSRKKPREQFDELRKIANLSLDVEELDRLNAADYAKRTEANREAKQKAAAANQIPIVAPRNPIDTDAILAEMRTAGEKNRKLSERAEKRRAFEAGTAKMEADASAKRAEAEDWRRKAEAAIVVWRELEKEAAERRATMANVEPVSAPVDVTELTERLQAAVASNAEHDEARAAMTRREALEVESAHLVAESEALTAAIEARDKQKRDAIQAAKLPVPGLGFGDGIVTYNGIPFDQAAASEQLKTSVAIGMAANPNLRVILIHDGSLLDSESMAQIAVMAEEHDYQCWIERVEDIGSSGFVIEDGSLKEAE